MSQEGQRRTVKKIYKLMSTLAYVETPVEQTWVKDTHTFVLVLREQSLDFYFLTGGYRYFECKVSEAYYKRIPELLKEWTK